MTRAYDDDADEAGDCGVAHVSRAGDDAERKDDGVGVPPACGGEWRT
jgi:hypothetical protein